MPTCVVHVQVEKYQRRNGTMYFCLHLLINSRAMLCKQTAVSLLVSKAQAMLSRNRAADAIGCLHFVVGREPSAQDALARLDAWLLLVRFCKPRAVFGGMKQVLLTFHATECCDPTFGVAQS